MEPSERPAHQASHSHVNSDDTTPSLGKKRVGFTADAAPPDESASPNPSPLRTPLRTPETEPASYPFPSPNPTELSHERLSEEVHKAFGQPYVPKPRPAIRRTPRTPPRFIVGEDAEEDDDEQKILSGLAAQERATRLARTVGTYSAPVSRRNSQDRLMSNTHSNSQPIELNNLNHQTDGAMTLAETTDDDDEPDPARPRNNFLEQADQLLRQHTMRGRPTLRPEDLYHANAGGLISGPATPVNEAEIEHEIVPRPSQYRTGILGVLLKTAGTNSGRSSKKHRRAISQSSTFSTTSTAASTPTSSPPASGTTTPVTPKPWFARSPNASSGSISKLIESSSVLATPAQKDVGHEISEQYKRRRAHGREKSSSSLASALNKFSSKAKDDPITIKIHIAGTLARQMYLRRLCRALMMYGAPTHRLEEYMSMSARVLEIEAQFLYLPECMIISFDDSSVHTTEVKLVRCSQGLDLGKLRDTHEVYKDVVHDRIGVEEATKRLDAIIARKPKFNNWIRIPLYGFASATVGPFAFQARLIDLPFCFVLGCILGFLQLYVAPQNQLLSNVFEIAAAVVTSFIARGLGSIKHNGQELFCFSAMAQSSIALILPGFTVLAASLELQSKHIVAGSVRMVYALIYSLFLGYGITIGTLFYGLMDKNATSATTCHDPMASHWYYFFVFGFSLCLMLINQCKWKQIPGMLVIALIGYAVNLNSAKGFPGNSQISSSLGALAIGISANVHARFGRHVENYLLDLWEWRLRPRWRTFKKRWQRGTHGRLRWFGSSAKERSESPSRSPYGRSESPFVPAIRKVGYGLAAATMLPAIFVQVPSGLSVSGSLVSGITSADQITRNASGVTTVGSGNDQNANVNSVALKVGFSVIQVAIGITVGLFLSALFVYPVGKKRSGLFSF